MRMSGRLRETTLSMILLITVIFITTVVGQHQGERILVPGASGSGPYEALVDWIAAFEAKFPEADFTVSSVGSGASQSALWGDIDCEKKPVEALCEQEGFQEILREAGEQEAEEEEESPVTVENAESITTKTIWGMGGGSLAEEDYIAHEVLDLQMLPALGGPVIPVYSKDITGNLGDDGDAGLNMTFDVLVGIFNGTITSWRDPSLLELNPNLALPKHPITVLVREDKSGMTQTLTQAMDNSVEGWPEDAVGKLPEWPLKLTHTSSDSTSCKTDLAGIHNFKADGQTGIGLGLLRRPYSIGYLELGYFGQLTSFVSQVHMASTAHPDTFVPATAETITTTMDGLVDVLDPATLELNLAKEVTPMGGYPISRYVYWYLKKNHTEFSSCYQAWLLCTFVQWTYEDPLAAEIASKHGWIVPPASVVNRSLEELREVQCVDDTFDEDSGSGMRIIAALDYVPPPYRISLNQISSIRPVGLALSAVVILTSIFFFTWVIWKRKLRIVRASQPEFLMMICGGTLILGAAIIPLTIDDSIASVEGCDTACMSFPWLACCGFTIAFSALFSKIWRVNKLFNSKQFRRVKVQAKDVVIPFAAMFTLNITFLLAWTVTDPLRWTREMIDSENSVGRCKASGGLAVVFVTLLVIVNASALILANLQAYRARGISDEFSESKYVAIAMASILQVFLIGLPLAWLVDENPSAKLFVSAGILVVVAMSLLLLIFVPKLYYTMEEAKKSVRKTEHSSGSFNGRSSGVSIGRGSTRISGLNMIDSEITEQLSAMMDADDDSEYGGAAVVSHPRLQEQLEKKNKSLKQENRKFRKKIKELERQVRAVEQIQQKRPSGVSISSIKAAFENTQKRLSNVSSGSLKKDCESDELQNSSNESTADLDEESGSLLQLPIPYTSGHNTCVDRFQDESVSVMSEIMSEVDIMSVDHSMNESLNGSMMGESMLNDDSENTTNF